jgi:hypothetical protein
MWTMTPHDLEIDRLGMLLRDADPAVSAAARTEIRKQFATAEAPLISELRLAGNEIASFETGFQNIKDPKIVSGILKKHLDDQNVPLQIKRWIIYSSNKKALAPYMSEYLIKKYKNVDEWIFDCELPIALANAISGMASKNDIRTLRALMLNESIGDTRAIIVAKFRSTIKKDMPDLLEELRAQGGSVAAALR